SPISSDKPISVWGGSACMDIPVGTGACDSAHQQLVSVQALGHDYVAVRYRDRVEGLNESVPWTMVGAVDGTKFTFDPPLMDAAIDSGDSAFIDTPDVFSVKSDDKHPFYLAGHMTGSNVIGPTGQGDPEYVTVIPPQQWLATYLFLTDPTYDNTNLVFVR